MNKKIIAIIIGIVVILFIGGTVTFLSKSGNDTGKQNIAGDINEGTNENTSKQYALIDNLPKYNNYDFYELKDAVNQDWFSKIGIAGEIKKGGPSSNPYSYSEVKLGYDIENRKEYLYPDAIILQGRLDGVESGYGQTIITKDQYANANGYEFFENVLKIAEFDDERIEELEKDLFNLTEENKSSENTEKFNVGYYNRIQKQIPWNLYDYITSDKFNMIFEVWEVENEERNIIDYYMEIDAGCSDQYAQENGDGKYRIILVYDDLKVNVNIPYSEDDEVKYRGEFVYYSGIINQEAYDAFLNSNN